MIGCRSDSHCPLKKSCINNKCIDICSMPTACGTNANCTVIDHQKQCTCPDLLIGDPLESCNYPSRTCSSKEECGEGQRCQDAACQRLCRT